VSLDLDERQRAIMAEMGVRVWWPASTPGESPALNAAVSLLALGMPE
jgi:hypothetical protein